MNDNRKYEIVLLSESNVKQEAVEKFIQQLFKEKKTTLKTINIPDSPERPEQPIGTKGTYKALELRNKTFFEDKMYENICDKDKITILLAIENGIIKNKTTKLWYDICCITLYIVSEGKITRGGTFMSPIKILINPEQMAKYQLFLQEQIKEKGDRFEMTFGEYITKHYQGETGIPKNNWMKHLAGIDRVTQILYGLIEAFNSMKLLDSN